MIASATLRSFRGVMGIPLASGDRGVEQTICILKCLIDDAVKDPSINAQAIGILRDSGVSNFGVMDRLRAFYDWISQPANFLYVPDPIGPFGPKETVRPARTLFQVKGGDCDDYCALLAALLGTVGIRTRLVTIAADRTSPNDFSHIYPEAEAAPGRWVPLDAARPGAQFGVAPPFYFRKRIWSLEDDSFQDVTGASRGPAARNLSSLNGYAMLGQSPAEDISAVGQSVANVIAASKGNPYASFATPYTPIAPPAGYGVPGYPGGAPGASLSFAGISPVWIVVGLVAIAAVSRRRY
jgi:hypothetical protein